MITIKYFARGKWIGEPLQQDLKVLGVFMFMLACVALAFCATRKDKEIKDENVNDSHSLY